MTECRQLLADYAQTRSEPAFREIVTRYLNLVYSAALRLVDGDDHRARDVAQMVFTDLARKAGELSPEVTLGGWLHRHTCFVAANLMRSERRRLARERSAAEMNSLDKDAGADFTHVAPLLDEAINQLDDTDRSAILLRFFEARDFRAVGQELETSEDAARMRVNRALDKLREFLARRGIRTTAAALSVAITANAVHAAPAALIASISAAAVSTGAISTSTVIAATKTIAMTTIQKTFVTVTIAALAGAGIYEARQASRLRVEVQQVQKQQAELAVQLRDLKKAQEETSRQWTTSRNEVKSTMSSNKPALASRPKPVPNDFVPSDQLEAELQRAYAESSPGRREVALQKLARTISSNDVPRALAFLAKRPGTEGVQSPLFAELAAGWGGNDPAAAVAWANALTDPEARKAALVGVLKGWTNKSPEAAAAYSVTLSPDDVREAAVMKVVGEWSFWGHADGAANWISQFPPGKLRDQAMGTVVFWGSGQCPATIADMLDATGDPEVIRKYGENVAIVWLNRDEPVARAWIEKSVLSDEVKERLLKPKE